MQGNVSLKAMLLKDFPLHLRVRPDLLVVGSVNTRPLETPSGILLLTQELLRFSPLHFVVEPLSLKAVARHLRQRKAGADGEHEAHRQKALSGQRSLQQDDARDGAKCGANEGYPGHVEK